ncbi:hypothetical protein BO82DRAFT_357641 [Aspergillus uvarum CBS 121591]|uniref:Uncharacterized protein n=1 Tax=Aspergillus uvarum CBS 121591 TaxID=1448315 RepID=A0A319CR72_9EURO|nr:hypothetical protein BO82DRAFT_357641 [Aspergillus uvarum CBS 121591]PYH78038.1 hypothetical protein BO82DRAFT_357641 [Aspergillus uvarum CBS 121591]
MHSLRAHWELRPVGAAIETFAIAVIALIVLHSDPLLNGLWVQTKWSFRRSRESKMQLIEVGAGQEAKAQRADSRMSREFDL